MADNFFSQFHKPKETDNSPRSMFIQDETGAMRAVRKSELKGDKGEIGVRGDKGDKGDSIKGKDGINGKDGRGIKQHRFENDVLYLQYDDGKIERVGAIVGKDGINGKDGRDGMQGMQGVAGEDGRGIEDAIINEDGELVITFDDGRQANAGKVKGDDYAGHGGVSNIGVGVQKNGITIGNGFSVINFTGSGISSVSQVDRKVTVNISSSGGNSVWGGITGTLSDQTDLQAALDSAYYWAIAL